MDAGATGAGDPAAAQPASAETAAAVRNKTGDVKATEIGRGPMPTSLSGTDPPVLYESKV
jgi:hypothetical protein